MPAADEKRFIIVPELAGILHVVNVWMNHSPDGYLKVEITVQNMTKSAQHFAYHIDWFNPDGSKLEGGDEGFTQWMLLPNEVSSISVTSTSLASADFEIAFVPAAQ